MTDPASAGPRDKTATRLLHISDVHFGAVLPALTPLLLAQIEVLAPDLVIISGDFTQTGSSREFEEAATFLEAIRQPVLTVPGNHDVPRFNLIERFFNPYRKYRKYVAPKLGQTFQDANICVAGINTARRILPHWNWAHGAISRAQLKWLKRQFDSSPAPFRICVMHHPVWKVTKAKLDNVIVYGGHRALKALKDMKVDLVLSGHVHHAAFESMQGAGGGHIIFLSASTALSRRVRGQQNGFNLIDVSRERVNLSIYGYLDGDFHPVETMEFPVGNET